MIVLGRKLELEENGCGSCSLKERVGKEDKELMLSGGKNDGEMN